jgi:hypothetical protein
MNGYVRNPLLGTVSASKMVIGLYPQAGVCVNVAKGINVATVSRIYTSLVFRGSNAFSDTTALVTTHGLIVTVKGID